MSTTPCDCCNMVCSDGLRNVRGEKLCVRCIQALRRGWEEGINDGMRDSIKALKTGSAMSVRSNPYDVLI